MKKIKGITLYEKKAGKVIPYHFMKKGRFSSLLRGCSNGRSDVLFRVRVTYNVDDYGNDPKNVSCWGNKKYVTDCFKEFTSADFLRSL